MIPMQPLLPLPLILGSALLLGAFSLWSIATSRTLLQRRHRAVALTLRLAAIALAAVILCNPSAPLPPGGDKPAGPCLVLADRSASMAGKRQAQVDQVASTFAASTLPCGVSLRQFGGQTAPFTAPFDAASASAAPATNLCGALIESLAPADGRLPAAVVVATDGRATDARRQGELLRLLTDTGVPVYPVAANAPFGGAPNLRITSLSIPRNIRPDEAFTLDASFACTDPGVASVNATVQDESGDTLAAFPVAMKDGKGSAKVTLTMPALAASWKLVADAVPGEKALDDNAATFKLDPRTDAIRVLYMEGSPESLYHPELGYWLPVKMFLPRAWKKAGMEVEVYTVPNQAAQTLVRVSDWRKGFCPTREEVMSFDVVVCSDIKRSNFSKEQLEWVRELVADKGGGFLMIGGDTAFGAGGWDRTLWEKLVPFTMTGYPIERFGAMNQEFDVVFDTASAADHPVLRLVPDPEENRRILSRGVHMRGSNMIKSAKPGATVLAHHSLFPDMPVLAVEPFGRGRTMGFTSDAAGGWGVVMMSTFGPGQGGNDGADADNRGFQGRGGSNAYYETLWTNAIRWLAENRIKDRAAKAELATPALNLGTGDTADFTLRLLDLPGDAAASATLNLGAGRTVAMERKSDKLWTAKLPLQDTDAGSLHATAVVRDAQGGELARVGANLDIRAASAELRDTSPDPAFLDQLAKASGGEVCSDGAEALAKIKARLTGKGASGAKPIVLPLWDKAWVLLLLAGLLCAEWAWRKRVAE